MHPEATHPRHTPRPLCCGGPVCVAVLAGCATSAPRSHRRPKRSRWHHQRHGRGQPDASAHAARAAPARAGRPASPAKDLLRDTLAYADRALDANATTLAREMARLGARRHQARPPPAAGTAADPDPTARRHGPRWAWCSAPWPTPTRRPAPLARLLEARLTHQRRLEEQLERQGQQLREAQRRNDQLSERLEAVRAIERSLQTRPAPAAASPSAPAAGASSPATAPNPDPHAHAFLHAPSRPAQHRILVVDDDADMLRLLSLRLKAAGHEVVAVGSAEAALAQLDIARPQLVLSDVRLPGKDGLALFDEVHARHPRCPSSCSPRTAPFPTRCRPPRAVCSPTSPSPMTAKSCWKKWPRPWPERPCGAPGA